MCELGKLLVMNVYSEKMGQLGDILASSKPHLSKTKRHFKTEQWKHILKNVDLITLKFLHLH